MNIQANEAVNLIREYVRITYGKDLNITSSQIEQLSWAMDNPNITPEMSADRLPSSIHREIPRDLARLYSLQLLRSGTEADYDDFILPQKDLDMAVLSQMHFDQLSDLIRGLDAESYDTLEAAALISAVTLSPTARERASVTLGIKLPEDSSQFLAVTAEKATSIYPLAKEIAKKYHSDGRKFTIVFLPGSHLRHMMYNEGSLNIYATLKKGFRSGQLKQEDLNLWYAYWMDNIAGFRGHVSAKGSLYLTENTYRSMNQIKIELDKLQKDQDFNPIPSYLIERAQWLKLPNYEGLSSREIQVLGALALFANALIISDLAETVEKVLPFYVNTLETAEEARKAGKLSETMPLSFRVLANDKQVRALLKATQPGIQVDPKNGLATFKQP